jgi:hypothetical protein
MFAGRNMSATHVAFASTRVMATCAVVGQGVGTAAAHALAKNLAPAELAANPPEMRGVQQRLLRDGCYLVGRTNEDPGDLARRAEVCASSQQQGGEAANVLTGQARSAHGKYGAPPGRSVPGSNRWMSDPSHGLPAHLELRWEGPVTAREVQLVFDTGLHRLLTLSHCTHYSPDMVWGRPQPETVADYEIQRLGGNGWETLEKVKGNWQRLRRHRLSEAIVTEALRVVITATNGLDHARICEVRVYAD